MGVADTDKLSSEDAVSDFVVWVLYALFLIAGAIVLVNLMIALLSNAFQGVEVILLATISLQKRFLLFLNLQLVWLSKIIAFDLIL